MGRGAEQATVNAAKHTQIRSAAWCMWAYLFVLGLKAQQINRRMSRWNRPTIHHEVTALRGRGAAANGFNVSCSVGRASRPSSNAYLGSFIALICWKDGKQLRRQRAAISQLDSVNVAHWLRVVVHKETHHRLRRWNKSLNHLRFPLLRTIVFKSAPKLQNRMLSKFNLHTKKSLSEEIYVFPSSTFKMFFIVKDGLKARETMQARML